MSSEIIAAIKKGIILMRCLIEYEYENLASDKVSLRAADMTGVKDGYDNRLGLKTSHKEIVSVIPFRQLFFITRDAKTNQD